MTKLNNRLGLSTPSMFPKFRCNFPNCTFSARRMALLKNHMRNHSQEKPFKCHFCSYSTQSRSNCKVHEQRMHTFQRPHKCHYCTYSCVQSTTLRQHVQMKHKERCQYRCFRCPNFHCQRESQLMFHLLKVHQTVAVTEISPYLNPNYLPDHMFPIGNMPTTSEYNPNQVEDQRVFAVGNSTVVQQQQVEPVQSQPRRNRRYNPTPYKLVRAANNSFPTNSNAILPQVTPRVSQSFIIQTTPNSTGPTVATWASSGKKDTTQYRREQQTNRQASLSDLSDHSLLASSSLIVPLDGAPEVIEITENDEEMNLSSEQKPDGHHQSDGGIYVCNHCLLTFTDEDGFLNHVMTNHPEGATLEPTETIEDSSHQQESTYQDSITSSSGLGFNYPTNQSSVIETSPVPVSITQGEFAAPSAVKQEETPGSLLDQESWLSTSHSDDRVVTDTGAPRRERIGSDTITESVFPNVQIRQRSTSVASHDSSLGQAVSARGGTPLLDMPSPTTTHCNNATASTQTLSSTANRGGTTPIQTKFCCTHCSIIFPDSVLFTIHRGAHGFHSPFECNFCGKDCGNKYEFASHLHNCS